ncbi:hypothetical protein PMI42_08124, partial [Bradyrhizobium sp. YR681]|uniref:hypothetical protein n=1 Tax=Bradyrhizobium sp. YR681 TaxID=1144344 RepID=UPI00026F7DD8
LAAIAAADFVGAGAVRAQQIPAEEPAFTAFVAERIRAELRDTPVVIKGPLTLSVGPLQTNLDRIYAFCKANRSGCANEIGAFVSGVKATASSRNDPPTRAALRVVVRSADYMRQALWDVDARGPALTRPLAEGLVIVPVLDSPRAVKVFNDRDRAALGLTQDQVFDIAIANLRSSLKPITTVAKVVPSGQFGTLTGDYYQTSRLALIDSWAPLAQAQGGVLIVAAPSADLVIYSSDDSSTAIDALRTLTKNMMARAPKPLSAALLRWTPKGWQLVR